MEEKLYKGIELLKEAVKEDKNGELEKAFRLYREGITLLMESYKSINSTTIKGN